MLSQTNPHDPWIFANDAKNRDQLRTWFGGPFRDKNICLVCVSNNVTAVTSFEMEDLDKGAVDRVAIIFVGRPIHLDAMREWRQWAMERCAALDLQMDSVPSDPTENDLRQAVERSCPGWFVDPLPPEEPAINFGKWVTMPTGATAKDAPALLTMMFGSMGELLTGVDVAARRFRDAVVDLDKGKRGYLEKIDSLLKDDHRSGKEGSNGGRRPSHATLRIGNVTDQLPKVLLRGETGVGKTLLAAYLHERCGLQGRPLHISIPEYLGKEDMFEYALFGYAAGNYTGGRKEGDHGLLLENVGGVVFLDEIGEANAALQAKLLTFLDHYQVRPRGWLGDPFYCPVLVVAATNRDLEERVADRPVFRRDLLARFTDRHRIPSLRDRIRDLPFILDCLLQRDSMNPGQFVREIGREAFALLGSETYEEGNFRELEDLFRVACGKARREHRRYLLQQDFKP